MSKSAFPQLHTIDGNWNREPLDKYNGISQRLYIATKIASAFCSGDSFENIDDMVRKSYQITDELIKQDK